MMIPVGEADAGWVARTMVPNLEICGARSFAWQLSDTRVSPPRIPRPSGPRGLDRLEIIYPQPQRETFGAQIAIGRGNARLKRHGRSSRSLQRLPCVSSPKEGGSSSPLLCSLAAAPDSSNVADFPVRSWPSGLRSMSSSRNRVRWV